MSKCKDDGCYVCDYRQNRTDNSVIGTLLQSPMLHADLSAGMISAPSPFKMLTKHDKTPSLPVPDTLMELNHPRLNCNIQQGPERRK